MLTPFARASRLNVVSRLLARVDTRLLLRNKSTVSPEHPGVLTIWKDAAPSIGVAVAIIGAVACGGVYVFMSHNMEVKLQLELAKKDIAFKDLNKDIALSEERSKRALVKAKKDIELAKKDIELAEERGKQAVGAAKKDIEAAKRETAERFLMYGYAEEFQRYRNKTNKSQKSDPESDNKEDNDENAEQSVSKG